MSNSLAFYPSSSKSQASIPQAALHTCEPCGSSCQQMAASQTREDGDVSFDQREGSSFSLRATAASQRQSTDEAGGSRPGSGPGGGPIDSIRLPPYQLQFGNGAATVQGCLQQCSSSVDRLQQSPYSELPSIPEEPPCFSSPSFSSHCTLSPVQQVSNRLYHNTDKSKSSKYSLSAQSHRQKTTLSFFPKPVYSYSILIFMALKNSKTGSLPVSEIYSFMTEHFPYFKTAPDGWKNSVRHNLSLNKCFVKMENKNGTSSRKGCLWALNPARIAKMQEELHKWRRKDPITVRRSMARPECLDHLLGERPDKLRSLPPYNSAVLLSRVAPAYSTTAAAQPLLPCLSAHRPECTHVQPQQPCYPPPAAAHPSNPFTQYSPCGQPAATASLNSPMAGKVPPVYDGTLQAEYGVGPRSMQDSLLEGDGGYDIDMLNPSLTDLQLQGNLWEELQEDSLRSDPHVTIIPQDHHVQSSCLQVTVSPVCWRKAECEDEKADSRWTSEQQNCLNGLHPVVCSGVESLAEYLTSCTTTISLM